MVVWLLPCSTAMCPGAAKRIDCTGYIKDPRCGRLGITMNLSELRVMIRVGLAASRLRGWFVSSFFQFWRGSFLFKFPCSKNWFQVLFHFGVEIWFWTYTYTALVQKRNCWAWIANTAWKEMWKCKPEWRCQLHHDWDYAWKQDYIRREWWHSCCVYIGSSRL